MTDEGYACRLSVEGIEVARRILVCLSSAFAFPTSEPIRASERPAQCVFRVAYSSQLTYTELIRLVSAVPGLRLRLAPAIKEVKIGK